MQKKKIFIEIAVPDQIKKHLAQKMEKYPDLPVKWTKKENLHITVSFVGYVDESVLPDICLKVRQVASNFGAFDLDFNTIELAPDAENPRLVSFSGQTSPELGKLNEAVEEALGMHPPKHNIFKPHITLGRIRKTQWEKLTEKPIIMEKLKMSISVDTVFVMESRGGGAEYMPLEECALA